MISRSKSAPTSLDDLPPFAAGRQAHLPRPRTAQSLSTTPFGTPWEAREDPFNLVGFFPSRPAKMREDWDWTRLREDEEYESSQQGEDEAYQEFHALALAEKDSSEKFVQQVIDGEDKYGMLAFSSENFPSLLRSKMPMFERPASPVYVSPIVVDEPLDLDALHVKYCEQRKRATGDVEGVREVGELFFGKDEQRAKAGWGEVLAQLVRFLSGGERG
ncbi:hypothetical protein K439DRAFT_1039555 [Ramaria rubella]|nr:hypothetical protein K439DRAFT_1039555 [Ramaria rubella]